MEAGDQTFTLAIHPRLTVIAGVGPLEREGLYSELVGARSTGALSIIEPSTKADAPKPSSEITHLGLT